jgi:hypothetical protein
VGGGRGRERESGSRSGRKGEKEGRGAGTGAKERKRGGGGVGTGAEERVGSGAKEREGVGEGPVVGQCGVGVKGNAVRFGDPLCVLGHVRNRVLNPESNRFHTSMKSVIT